MKLILKAELFNGPYEYLPIAETTVAAAGGLLELKGGCRELAMALGLQMRERLTEMLYAQREQEAQAAEKEEPIS